MSTGTYFGGYDPDDDDGFTPFEEFQRATKIVIRLLVLVIAAAVLGVAVYWLNS